MGSHTTGTHPTFSTGCISTSTCNLSAIHYTQTITTRDDPSGSKSERRDPLGISRTSQRGRVGSHDTPLLPKPVQSPEESLSYYLQEIGAIPLLTAAEEIQLAQLIERGRQVQRKLEQPLNAQEHSIAIQESKQGEQARHKLIESNLRLVVSIARRYSRDRDLRRATSG